MFALKREGLTSAEIAAKVGVKQQTVSNKLSTLRKEMRQKWKARVAQIAALAFAVLVFVLAWDKREEMAHLFRRTPAPTPSPTRRAPEMSIPVAPSGGGASPAGRRGLRAEGVRGVLR
jgi:hypothetical protein